mgnify:FL=1
MGGGFHLPSGNWGVGHLIEFDVHCSGLFGQVGNRPVQAHWRRAKKFNGFGHLRSRSGTQMRNQFDGTYGGTDTEHILAKESAGSAVQLALTRLERNTASFCELQFQLFRSSAARFNTVVSMMHQLCADLDNLESEGVAHGLLAEIVRPAAILQGLAPFIHRLQTQPRGYPGDL